MKSSTNISGHIACFTAYAIFGVNIIVCKDLTSGHLISPIGIFTLRSLGAGLMFWILSLFLPAEKVEKKDYLKILAAAFLGYFLTQLSFLMAIPDVTPMHCSIISSMSPIYTMFIAAIVLKEPLSYQKAGGVLLSFAGIIYLIITRVATPGGAAETTPFGIFMLILNVLSFSMYLGIFKPLIAKYSVVTFMNWIFLFSAIVAVPFSTKGLISTDWAGIPAIQYAELSYLIICATFISYFLIPVAQKRIRPTLISMYSYVQPIIAIAVSIAIGMDTLTWQKALATLLVFSGLIIVNYSRSKSGS
jgi:drug/metabolite transporter (DMT)-like permease